MVEDLTNLDRMFTLELARVTEAAAIAASRLVGRGDERAADQAAVDAMRRALNSLDVEGTVVIGEGEKGAIFRRNRDILDHLPSPQIVDHSVFLGSDCLLQNGSKALL